MKTTQSLSALEGVEHIEKAAWITDRFGTMNLYVTGPSGHQVHAWIELRPVYCDRGHIQFNISGVEFDRMDSFPRFFFSFAEADAHVRTFLKWRLWKHRTFPHKLP